MYLDARITRIYEGTNETNRMIVPTRLLKHGAGRFSLDAAADAIDRHPSPIASEQSSPLAVERDFLGRAKKLARGLLGQASSTYASELKDAQEVQAQIADVIIEVFAIESGLARAEKMAGRAHSRAGLAADVVRVYVSEAADRIASAARQVVAALSASSGDSSLAARVEPLTRHAALDTIAVRRRIAHAVIEAGKHPF